MPEAAHPDVVARRRRNLKAWIDTHFRGVQAAFVEHTGINQGELSGLLKAKSFGEKKARALEKQAGIPFGWLDELHDAELIQQEIARAYYGTRRIWVIGNTQGGLPDRIWTDGDFPAGASDEYAEVATDDNHAFVVRVRGDSMLPRYQPGEFALVEPDTAPEIEDDVLVRLATGETMLKRLLSRRGGIRLGSYNSTEVLTYTHDEITWMYYVSHPIPARKIKHWVAAPEYVGEDRRHEHIPTHQPERRSGYKLPEPKTEMEHVYGRTLPPETKRKTK